MTVSDGMAAAMARVAQLQSLVTGPRPPSSGSASSTGTSTGGTSATGSRFAASLTQALGGTGEATASGAGSDLSAKVIEIGKKYLGTPYKWGGTDPSTGLDCSGFTQLVYKQVGVRLPRVSHDQAHAGAKVGSLADAKPGDLVFFDSPVHHVGIYLGDNQMMDAPHTGDVVKIQKVWEKPSAIRRVLPDTVAASGSSSGTSGLSAITGASVRTGGLTGPYTDLFTAAGKRHGVDPALLSAVAKAESGYKPNAVSRAGAQGLMQLMPSTAKGLGVDAKDPAQAIDGAARLLAGYLRDYHGRTDLALAAYNAGPGAVRKYGGVPPYSETRTYVNRVTQNWESLR